MRKLAIAALAFSAGTALCHYLLPLSALPYAALGALVLCLLGLIWRGETRLRLLLIGGALAAAFVYNLAYITDVRDRVDHWVGEDMAVEAQVLDYAAYTGSRYRLPVRVKGEQEITAMLYGGEELCALVPGDTVSGQMTVQDASSIHDDPLTAFTAKGRFLLLFFKDELEVVPGERSIRFWPKYAAKKVGETIDLLYGERFAPFLRALLVGDRTELTETQNTILSEAGVYHITSVSGMHCSFLFGIVAWLVGKQRQRLLAAVAIPLLWGYVLLVGCQASMVRAAVMLTLLLLGPLFDRESDAVTALSLALLILLLANPYAVADIGLQLSFGAMAGLLLLSPRVYRLFPTIRNRALRSAWRTVSASIGVIAVTAPLSAVYFNNISLLGPIANILLLWVSPVTFGAGVASVAAGLLLPPVGMVAALVASGGAWCILAMSELITRIPYHAVYFTNPYLKYWLVYALALFAYCAAAGKGRRKYALAAVLASVSLVVTAWLPVQQSRCRLYAVSVNVGQGASTLLSSNGAAALVDCGSNNSFIDAGDAAADLLNTCGYYTLDYLILTHYHTDHANGIEALLARLRVETILAPVPMEEEPLHEVLTELAEKYGITLRYITEDAAFPLGDASVQVFAPVGMGGTNEEGLSMVCSEGNFDLLVTGDMNTTNEQVLSARKNLPDIEVLLVGHHGSKYATSEALLESCAPEVGIISVGTNSYGHPTEEAMQRMVRRGMTLYRTDMQGNITIRIE